MYLLPGFLFLKCYQALAGQHIKMVGWFWGEGCYSNSKFSSNGFTACNVKNFYNFSVLCER